MSESEGAPAVFVKDLLGNPGADSQRTVSLGASLAPGLSLQGVLFYRCEAFVSAVRRDVRALLDAFTRDDKHATSYGGEESPFERMKRVWRERGWLFVHLLGSSDGQSRPYWADTVAHLIMENIQERGNESDSIAALFAIYLFWATQPTKMQQVYVKTDSSTLIFIASMPDTLAQKYPDQEALLQDVRAVVYQLLSQSAFFIVPHETYLHPPLPTIRVERRTEDETTRQLNELRRIEREMEQLRQNGVIPQALDPALEDETAAPSRTSWYSDLHERERDYVGFRDGAFGTPPSGPGHDRLAMSVLERAKGMTYKALRDAGSAATSTAAAPPPAEPTPTTRAQQEQPVLFGLIGQGSEVEGSKGLHQFDEAIASLQSQS